MSISLITANSQGGVPAFSAYQSVAQTGIAAATATPITFTSVNYDTNSCYNTSLSTFTPNVAGYYFVTSFVTFPDAGGTNGLAVLIQKNSTTVTWGASSRGVNGQIYAGSLATAIVYMNGTTDYVRILGYFGTASTGSTFASASQTNFSACLIRSA